MKKLTATILACGILGFGLREAGAAPQLKISDGTTTITVVDESPDDAAIGIPGMVEYVGPVGPNWVLDVSVGTDVGSSTAPSLDLGSFNNSSGAGTLTVDFTQDGFTGAGPATLNIGGTTSGQVTYNVWVDAANNPFAKTTLIGTVGPLAGGSGGLFTGTAAGIVPPANPYSITSEAIIEHAASGHTGLDASLEIIPPLCNCALTFNSPTSITNCAGDTIPNVVASENCGNGSVSVPVTLVGAVTNGSCPKIITRTNSATDDCGGVHTFVQTITVNCNPDCTLKSSVTNAVAGTGGLHAWVANAGPGANYFWTINNGSITNGQGTTNIAWVAGTDLTKPVTICVSVSTAGGCITKCCLSVPVTETPGCTITGVTISDTSWNKFNIPNGTSPYVWVHAHIGTPKGIPTNGVTTVQFVGVSISLNGTSYAMPDGVMVFDSSAPSTITTTFSGGKWITTVNPKNLSDEMFFTGAAIPVTPAIAAGAKATLTYTTVSSVPGISFSWQWSAAVYTFWPADWNQALIQPYHQGNHAGTPLNTTVQNSLIQGPRGGGGSNFTGSWSATGKAACQ